MNEKVRGCVTREPRYFPSSLSTIWALTILSCCLRVVIRMVRLSSGKGFERFWTWWLHNSFEQINGFIMNLKTPTSVLPCVYRSICFYQADFKSWQCHKEATRRALSAESLLFSSHNLTVIRRFHIFDLSTSHSKSHKIAIHVNMFSKFTLITIMVVGILAPVPTTAVPTTAVSSILNLLNPWPSTLIRPFSTQSSLSRFDEGLPDH